MRGFILWDFEGTLVSRRGRWAGAIVETLDSLSPSHGVGIEDLRPHLQSGFPWHQPQRPHPELSTPDAWWSAVGSVIARAVESTGIDTGIAKDVGIGVRERYLDVKSFDVFPDVIPALQRLGDHGWTHLMLSNHVPELRSLVEKLGLGQYFACVISSANSGFEKPHAEAFKAALKVVDDMARIWMIGDDPDADALGAEAAGISAVLIRNSDPRVSRTAADLFAAAALIEREDV